MHNLGFSKEFLPWKVDYLTDWREMVQIDKRKSDMATVEFVVQQGSILYIADLQKEWKCLLSVHWQYYFLCPLEPPVTWTPQQLK